MNEQRTWQFVFEIPFGISTFLKKEFSHFDFVITSRMLVKLLLVEWIILIQVKGRYSISNDPFIDFDTYEYRSHLIIDEYTEKKISSSEGNDGTEINKSIRSGSIKMDENVLLRTVLLFILCTIVNHL
ncbi:hypothetical protein GJ496_001718 [Pomphorhynchus laevis]|nr:hypothetical protein GJ496_001718 [Pomphorhynchus laevis]